MKAERDVKTGKWLIQYRYTDWQGNRKKSTKRGFNTKREAEEWLRNFLVTQQADFNMLFEDFIKIYYADMETRLREHTMRTKKYLIDLKLLPYFGKMKLNEIKAADIRKWQNELMQQGYAPTYLRTINNQLAAIFNYAVKYYDLPNNPCRKAGSMGKGKADEMQFWTKEEFEQFIDVVMNKQQSYMAFMTLFWTGMRMGELLALVVSDVDFQKRTISITKSYQRMGGRDVITEPKTPKSKRVITIPQFLAVDLQDYLNSMYGVQDEDRLFPITKYYLEHEMERGIKGSGVKRIRIHDLRHSHVSLSQGYF
ncbi:MAG: site-specific integrase [Lachnospiraceae bacterium]|nr:site-specific integrase [Lachnospiraceae bacterium]